MGSTPNLTNPLTLSLVGYGCLGALEFESGLGFHPPFVNQEGSQPNPNPLRSMCHYYCKAICDFGVKATQYRIYMLGFTYYCQFGMNCRCWLNVMKLIVYIVIYPYKLLMSDRSLYNLLARKSTHFLCLFITHALIM